MAEFRLSNFTSGTALTAAELNAGLTFADYTPTWTQSVAITKTVDWARYTKFGKLIVGSIKMTASSAGTANNKVLVGLPVSASTNNLVIGKMAFFDSSGSNSVKYYWNITALFESETTMAFHPFRLESSQTISDTDARFGQTFNIVGQTGTSPTIASGDIIWVQFEYEAA